MMNKRMIFILGEIYGRLSTVVPSAEDPAQFKQACINPFLGFSTVYLKARQSGALTKEIEDYIGVRLTDVDADEVTGTCDVETQGVFQIGYYKGKTPKTAAQLIERIGKSYQKIADELNVSKMTVARWAQGTEPSEGKKYLLEKMTWDF